MKTLGLLMASMGAAIVLAGSLSYAAPTCCDPAQAQNVIKNPALTAEVRGPGMFGLANTKSAPRASQPTSVMPQISYGPQTQARRPVAPPPVQLSSVYRPVGPVAARAGGGCCPAATNLSATPVQTVGRCGGACPSCLSRGNVARPQARPSVQPSVPQCCSGRGSNLAPAVQAPLKAGGNVLGNPVTTAMPPIPGNPAMLTANPGSNRSQAPRFITLW
jgi:hypothetical protein